MLRFQSRPLSPPSIALSACIPRVGGAATSLRRHIPLIPTRILDAPNLRDDYYLNLLAWSNSNLLAIALDTVVYVYNVDSGGVTAVRAIQGGREYVTSVAWLSDRMLAVGTSNAHIQLWDTGAAKCTRTLVQAHHERIGSLAWNPSMQVLSSGSRDAKIIQHDIKAPNAAVAMLYGHTQEICGLLWSPDGKTLASGGNDNRLSLWDGMSTTPRLTLSQHTAAVKALAWCPWERHLLASGGGTADRCIKIWQATTGAMEHSIHTGSQVCGLVWSPIQKELLSSHGYSQNELCLWAYPRMNRIKEFTGHTARVLHMALSPDGASVVSAAADETLRFWSVFGPPSASTRPPRFHLTSSLCGVR
ncbi:hypothetical protein DYB30_004912 [Aphanomyces astaci]|uniref:CDC20/Fizzy WD40 domain-containing protein n=1 Tax=Aphanomyces astaci TaxID=112090 RepID=A0A397DD57_APHAT|nr:hypothetical protein DYB34_003817 [Aphanomyces astaci]RHY59457.1 hypothetical protein DYB30_004912 [Aphanomyces astaci]RHZ16653.1 hypothetical protein DYB31_002050 [Aphanomyces astaci]